MFLAFVNGIRIEGGNRSISISQGDDQICVADRETALLLEDALHAWLFEYKREPQNDAGK